MKELQPNKFKQPKQINFATLILIWPTDSTNRTRIRDVRL